jgi:hypothetical protein
MSSEAKTSITDRRLKLAGERERMIKELIQPYDKEVYNPAMQKLREDCAGEGHEAVPRTGSVWRICGKCGGSYLG